MDGVMGASAVNLLRFIEGSEYSGMLTFVSLLDTIWNNFSGLKPHSPWFWTSL